MTSCSRAAPLMRYVSLCVSPSRSFHTGTSCAYGQDLTENVYSNYVWTAIGFESEQL